MDEVLESFFIPQAAQLGLEPRPLRLGLGGTASGAWGTGALWAAQAAPGCLVTSHTVECRMPVGLRETPASDYLCVMACSAQTLPLSPAPAPATVRDEDNVVSFSARAGTWEGALEATGRYRSVAIVLLPSCLARLRRRWPGDFDRLGDDLAAGAAHLAQDLLVPVLGSLGPALAERPGAEALLAGRVAEALSLVAEAGRAARADGRGAAGGGATCDGGAAGLVARAEALVRADVAAPADIASLCRALHVGRTTLCCAFRAERGCGPARRIRELRLERARDLLAGSGASVAEVARAVGYTREATFREAFRSSCGVTPAAWREAFRRGSA